VDGAQRAFETRRIYPNLSGLNMARGRSCRMISTREMLGCLKPGLGLSIGPGDSPSQQARSSMVLLKRVFTLLHSNYLLSRAAFTRCMVILHKVPALRGCCYMHTLGGLRPHASLLHVGRSDQSWSKSNEVRACALGEVQLHFSLMTSHLSLLLRCLCACPGKSMLHS
jgi:hypothetical protein